MAKTQANWAETPNPFQFEGLASVRLYDKPDRKGLSHMHVATPKCPEYIMNLYAYDILPLLGKPPIRVGYYAWAAPYR